jgi:hypothetical protein
MRKSSDIVLLKGMFFLFSNLSALGCSSEEIDARLKSNLVHGLNNDTIPEYSDNLALLFHCTRQTKIDDILAQGLDSRLGAGGLLGRGMYFADVLCLPLTCLKDPLKSIQYDAVGKLLIFLVMLGDCLHVVSQDGTRVRELEKNQNPILN